MVKPSAVWTRLRSHALRLPEADEDFPWGDRVVKGPRPMRYGLGKAGWVTIPLRGGPPPELMLDRITESDVLVAPKRPAASIEA